MYGSPSRGQANIHTGKDQTPDFMGRFNAGGAGAPLRDNQGNIITSRKPEAGQIGILNNQQNV